MDNLYNKREKGRMGGEDTTSILDSLNFNMLDHETQKDLLKDTVSLKKALEIANYIEMGAQINKRSSPAEAAKTLHSITNCSPNSTLAFLLIVDKVGSITIVKNAPQMKKKYNNCGNMCKLWKLCNPKNSKAQSSKSQQTKVNQIDTTTVTIHHSQNSIVTFKFFNHTAIASIGW